MTDLAERISASLTEDLMFRRKRKSPPPAEENTENKNDQDLRDEITEEEPIIDINYFIMHL